ncbi:4-oxalomesaconate hydratase [Companilactobacillus crustorum]|uniref:Amidohydrolase n=3 Tax=Companilactobacillus TaxID=2767879 RepID=A0A2P4R8E8_9LACO|nr:amidohydrolase family protein [Companilactobacillus crustorum]KRK42395.1 putative aminocarboxymuconate-semialdehyde decarboxylase [Companilactobacillus crustorum JCM 15951]KRO21243.1 putative aminocarboxymuconate-semialdehyde decarboxylase [Companilactobacillus crustorum]GEO76636.1 4-oxalomesaconate hydratase [Companilactobacillus crustorum]
MDLKLDIFAHVLPTGLLNSVQEKVPNIIEEMQFLKIPALTDLKIRRNDFPTDVKQIISNVNLNPEDYFDPMQAAELCQSGNEELLEMATKNEDIFAGAVAMLPMNNIPKSLEIIDQQVLANDKFIGVQLFTRAIGKSIADVDFEPIFMKLAEANLPILLHPVFDTTKRDNNVTFSWEYELTQAMNQIVKAGYFEKYPNLKIIVHHAGAMVPYFSQRIKYTMTSQEYQDFKKFYVDTAILGNSKALELAIDFFGTEHMIFGTDAPFAVIPNGTTKEIVTAINEMNVSVQVKKDIFSNNLLKLIR